MSVRMPAEWEEHEATWLAWPYDKISFGSLNELGEKTDEGRLGRVERVFTKIITELSKNERVDLIVRDISKPPIQGKNIQLYQADYADVWTRDYMPSFLADGSAVKWDYDAYGAKFPELIKDTRIWGGLNSKLKIDTTSPGILLEGGAVEVNGAGTLITTEQCLLNRNSKLRKKEYDDLFKKYLGITQVVWLKEGIVNDHTDGHVDDVAKFVSAKKVLCAFEDNPSDRNYEILNEAYAKLSQTFEVIKLPMPHVLYRNGQNAPASYANFYVANKLVLVPTYNDPNDRPAMEIIRVQFPDRDIIGIDCTDLIYGGGAIHCATREQPLIV